MTDLNSTSTNVVVGACQTLNILSGGTAIDHTNHGTVNGFRLNNSGGEVGGTSCRAGQCGSCKVMLLDGAVEHDCADALSLDDAREGFILSCEARPLGTVVVDL
jgi:hypothetical protein